ncbi:MAG: hypothetical protein KGY81_09595 [Phycisphaerae bacterium]|jgi:hypothetical protein|nr:hypothetical protein [Phycisphaerae bacterium]
MIRQRDLSVLAMAWLLALTTPAGAQALGEPGGVPIPLPLDEDESIPMPQGDGPTMPDDRGERHIELRMGKPRDYPAAGLRLTLPIGFRRQPLIDPYAVVSAARNEGMHRALSVAISAYPMQKGVEPGQIVQNVLDEMDGNIAIRRLEIEPPSTVKLAAQQAVARTMSYKFRGVRTAGIVACFVRTFDADADGVPPHPVAYLFTIEVLQRYRAILDDLVAEVGNGASFIDFRSPAALTIDRTGPYVRDYDAGYAIRQPADWAAQFNDLGIALGRMDYLLGDIVSPTVQLMSTEIPADETSRHCGRQTIEFERKQGWDIEVLSQGSRTLAGRKAWQIVLRKKHGRKSQPAEATREANLDADEPPAPTSDDDATAEPDPRDVASVEVRRLMCMPAEDGAERKQHISVIVTCHDATPERAVEIMDVMADGFSLLVKTEDIDDPGEIKMPDDVERTITLPR